MPGLHLDSLVVRRQGPGPLRTRLWREWCFAQAVVRRFGVRLLIIAAILVAGAVLFRIYEPESRHSFLKAMYLTFALVFGEAPEEFPSAPVLQAVFFVVPILGLTVIIEGLVELWMMLRDRRRMEQGWCRMMAASMRDHVILVGMGRLGYLTFRLLRKLGVPVVVLERDGNNQFLEDVRRDGSPLLVGDARREAMLVDANVATARSVILATTDDLANLEIALDARRLRSDIRIVLRMFDQNMANKIREGFDIKLAMSQSAISAPAFAMAALDTSIVNSFVVQNRLVVMQRWQVREGGPLCGKTVGQAMAAFSFGIVEHRSPGGPPRLFPTPDVKLQDGDELLVQGAFETLMELKSRAVAAAAG